MNVCEIGRSGKDVYIKYYDDSSSDTCYFNPIILKIQRVGDKWEVRIAVEDRIESSFFDRIKMPLDIWDKYVIG